MNIVNKHSLRSHTIVKITYIRNKNRLIFTLENGNEIMTKTPYENHEGNIITSTNLFTKNYNHIDFQDINITIKDIGWEGTSFGIDYMFIVDTKADVYRTPCYKTQIYNYTDHKNKKAAKKKKRSQTMENIKTLLYPYEKI